MPRAKRMRQPRSIQTGPALGHPAFANSPTPARIVEPTSFRCAVCGKNRARLDAQKRETYLLAPNGDMNCFACVATREAKDLASGKITMDILLQSGRWWAVSASRKITFPLVVEPRATDAMVVAKPRFVDKDGYLWVGRLYESGISAFQKSVVNVKAGLAATAKKKPQAKKPAAKKPVAKKPTAKKPPAFPTRM